MKAPLSFSSLANKLIGAWGSNVIAADSQQISSAPRQRFDDEDVESVHLFDRAGSAKRWSRPASAASRVRQRFSVRRGFLHMPSSYLV